MGTNMSTPHPDDERIVEEFDEIWKLTEDLVSNGAIINKHDFQQAWKDKLRTTLATIRANYEMEKTDLLATHYSHQEVLDKLKEARREERNQFLTILTKLYQAGDARKDMTMEYWQRINSKLTPTPPTEEVSKQHCIECGEIVEEDEPVKNCHGYCRLEL